MVLCGVITLLLMWTMSSDLILDEFSVKKKIKIFTELVLVSCTYTILCFTNENFLLRASRLSSYFLKILINLDSNFNSLKIPSFHFDLKKKLYANI